MRGVINSINRAGTVGRRESIRQITSTTGVKAKLIRARMSTRRAKLRRPTLRVRPSSQGIPAREYPYQVERVGFGRNKTRGRIRVPWVGARTKIAAGFINPLSERKRPLCTRNHKGKLNVPEMAIAPSVAAAWKALPKGAIERQTEQALRDNLKRDIPAQIAKAIRA